MALIISRQYRHDDIIAENMKLGRFRKSACSSVKLQVWDAIYDRDSTFPLINCFLDGGSPEPQIVGMAILFRKMELLYTWAEIIYRDAF